MNKTLMITGDTRHLAMRMELFPKNVGSIEVFGA